MDRPVIVHISGDFPDCIAPNKTRAITNLVEATSEFDHIVYSLNRYPHGAESNRCSSSNNKIALAYGAPSKGFFLRSRMEALADWIVASLVARRRQIDVIHAHKLTIEGIAGRRIADAMKIPFVCSVQTDTDTKIVWARPDLRAHFRHIWKTADYAVPFSPRSREGMNAQTGRTKRQNVASAVHNSSRPFASGETGPKLPVHKHFSFWLVYSQKRKGSHSGDPTCLKRTSRYQA